MLFWSACSEKDDGCDADRGAGELAAVDCFVVEEPGVENGGYGWHADDCCDETDGSALECDDAGDGAGRGG